MHTIRARQLFLALLVLGGVALVGLAIAYHPAPITVADAAPAAQPSLEARAVLTPTHPYTPTLQFITAAGGGGSAIVSGDGYAYVGDGVQLSIFDVSNPNAPQWVRRLGLRGAICQMQLAGSRLYVAANFGGLRIYEVSDPAQPRLLGVYAEEQITCPFYAAGDLVYAVNKGSLQAIDVSNPAAPVLRDAVAIYYDLIRHSDILSAGEQVYVGANVVDAINPDQLEIAATVTGTWVALGDGLAVADGVECFKGSCWGGLVFYDISDPANPLRVGGYPLGSTVESVLVDGDILVYSFVDQSTILDISQPLTPVLLNTYPGKAYEKDGDKLYVSGWSYVDPDGLSGVDVLDISQPAQPDLVGRYTTPNPVYGYARWGKTIYLQTITPFGNYYDLQLVDVTDPSNPYMAGNSSEAGIFSVSKARVQGERSYILSNAFIILDYRNAFAPGVLGSHKVSDLGLYDLNIVGNYAYINGGEQIKILDIHDPSQPTIIQTYGGNEDEPWGAAALKVLGNGMSYVVASFSEAYRTDLQIMQFDPPAPPVVYSVHTSPPNEYITALDGDAQHVFIARTSGAVELLDTSNPYSPTLTGFYSSTQYVRVLREAGDLLLLGGDGKLAIVDFSNPLSPSLVSEVAIPIQINDIQVDGGWAYVAADDYWAEYGDNQPGVWVVDISDPYHPTLQGIYPTNAKYVQIVGGLMYVSAGWNGLQVVSLWQPSMFLPQVLMENP
jgi:hypothetical protein